MSVEDASTPAELSGLLITAPTDKGSGTGAAGKDGTDVHVDALIDDGDDNGDDWNSDDTEQPDPAKGDDEGEGAKEGDDEGDADEGQDTEARYTVKIDGKEEVVSLSEALAGYQRSKDYTLKTQALAESRKAIDTELATVREARETYSGYLKTLSEKIGAEADEPTPEQWNALKASDPERYSTEWVDYQRRKEARGNIKAEQDRLDGEKQAEGRKALGEHITKQREALFEKIPDWKDPKKYEAGAKKVFAFAKEAYGYSDAELAQAYDHRIVLMAEDARKYRALMAQKDKAKGKLEDAPTVPPRARAPQLGTKRQEVKAEAEKRFNKTGRVEDAVPLLFK